MENDILQTEFFKQNAKILIVDDEQDTLDIFRRHLEDEYDIDTADSAEEALEKLERSTYHIAMTDMVMPRTDGIELLTQIKKRWPHVSVIVISGKASIGMAVEAMKIGAEEFVEKPVEDLDLLKIIIKKILKTKWQHEEIERLRSILTQEFDRTQVIGNSLSIQKVMEKVKKIAPLDTTILITGETGVGKDLFADLIYRNSKRKNQKFVAVNCGGLPENLLESMLFGHKKGSFTDAIRDKIGYFQEADGGTLFLDEITETTKTFQVKLLRVLEKSMIRQVGGDMDIEVDVRVITSTNKNIENEVKEGNFRRDLYYRLNIIHIHIPPLRERRDDIVLLANAFVREFAEKYEKPNLEISDSVMPVLLSCQWEGNIRELKNAIEHAVAMSAHNKIVLEDLPSTIYTKQDVNVDDNLSYNVNQPFAEAKDAFEKNYVEKLLQKCGGDVSKAAELSGIKRPNLYEKFNKHNIDVNSFRKN
ncbi:MAG: sigma-54-dependent Fis family transcriptional regulator [Candidatus Cloacimonetes bacterium]|nr:sigma-54-dependent Fis family transcriptional regulator [Candidatus Cloacimonadota bacterium]